MTVIFMCVRRKQWQRSVLGLSHRYRRFGCKPAASRSVNTREQQQDELLLHSNTLKGKVKGYLNDNIHVFDSMQAILVKM